MRPYPVTMFLRSRIDILDARFDDMNKDRASFETTWTLHPCDNAQA